MSTNQKIIFSLYATVWSFTCHSYIMASLMPRPIMIISPAAPPHALTNSSSRAGRTCGSSGRTLNILLVIQCITDSPVRYARCNSDVALSGCMLQLKHLTMTIFNWMGCNYNYWWLIIRIEIYDHVQHVSSNWHLSSPLPQSLNSNISAGRHTVILVSLAWSIPQIVIGAHS